MKTPKLLQLAIANAGRSKPMRAETNTEEPVIYLHGIIGGWWGDIDETEFVKTLAAIDASKIHLRINSPGGDVFASRAMMTAIAQHPATVIGHIDGLAASAATGICMACDEVEMSQGADFMIHEAWTIALGNKGDMSKTSELLAKIDAGLVRDYAARTGQDAAQIEQWMAEETWFDADEAVKYKFVDRVVEVVEKRQSNALNLSAYANAPRAVQTSAQPSDDTDTLIASHRNALERRFSLLERTPA